MDNNKEIMPDYGSLDHYLGDKGAAYFGGQNFDDTQMLYNRHIWQPYISADDDILDFGCSGGFLLHVLNAKKKIGVEINPHAKEFAEKHGIVVYSTLDQVPGKFDKVISSHTLEHVPHPRQALLELKEKLRNEKSLMLLLLPLEDWRSNSNRVYKENDKNMHLYAWTPLLLGNLISSCGMKVNNIRVITHAWPHKHELFWRISPRLFHLAAYWRSLFDKQIQLFAIASLK
jgi:SAM-dependent methyltransferase